MSGESQRSQSWIRQVETELGPLFDGVVQHDYAHWANSDQPGIDFDRELDELLSKMANEKNYLVFAKSIGTVLTLQAIQQDVLTPAKCVLVGTPLALLEDKDNDFDYGVLTAKASMPKLYIQHTHDPLGSVAALANVLERDEVADYRLIGLPGETHDYLEFPRLKTFVGDFVAE